MTSRKPKRVTQSEFDTLISRTRSVLTLEHPFFGVLSFGMEHVLDDTINPPTACVDGMTVSYHPEFVASLTKDEMLFLVAHECMHPMLDHIGRMTGREPKRWNIACDIVVNHYLKQDNIGRMPECGITDPALFAKGQGVVEVIYNLLESNEGQGQGQSTPSHDQMDAMQEADASEGQVQSKWKPLVMQAQAAAKQAGKLSGALERLVKQAVVAPPNWRQIMAEWMSRSAMGDQRTWSRPSRRMAAAGMYRPATYSEAIGEIVIAVDCSGSVSPELLDKFMAHVRALCEDIQPKRIHIAYFHHTVFRVDSYENADDMVINITESGGTAFSPIFRRVDADGIDPVCCVVLTDLECSDYGPQPGYPVLWASTTDAKAPWGRTIRID